jgi:two-component system, OmpR family, heavy metal sensor histidine kinase CusS
MFSTRAEPAPAPLEAGRESRRWAMSTKLTLLYTVCTCVLLSVASALLYWSLERSLMSDDEAFLAHKMQVLALILGKRPFDRGGLEQEVRDEAEISMRSRSPYQLRVLTRDGRLVTETPGMSTAVPIEAFADSAVDGGSHGLASQLGGKTFLLEAMSLGGPSAGGWRVQAALDVDADIDLLRRYRRDVIILLAAGLMLAAGLGAWITRRGLRPLADITRTTQRIGAHRLEERLRPAAWPAELAALAREFDRMLERLQEAFGRLTRFSADLAHELRTPINNLIGETEVVLAHPRTEQQYARVLQSALEEYARLARMIDSMLFLAQADQDSLPLERAPLEARSELEAVAEFYRPLAQEQGVELLCEGRCRIEADPLLLRRALSNLLSNAIRYTPHGGRVTLRAAVDTGPTPVLSVSDTGTGIPPQHMPRLGERFYRVEPSRTAGACGSGLGLAIVRSIMALHGGRFSIDSRPGAGTTASLLFPPISQMTIRSS